jgi:ABC-2 type transport system permease protein
MATGNSMMQLVTGSGWSRGLENALRGELRRWFSTRTWWVQILIWTASINVIFFMVAISTRGTQASVEEAMMIFNIFMGLVGPIGVSIVMQSVVVGEKRAGTASWLLSKPVSRVSFILSKLIANTAGIAATMVLAQGIIAYLIAAVLLHITPGVPGYLASLGVHMANIFFYLTMTLMLGAIFEHPGPVIGIPLAFLFSQNFLGSAIPGIIKMMPWVLAIPLNGSNEPSLASALMSGVHLPPFLPLYTTLAASVVFVIVALLVFQKQEL